MFTPLNFCVSIILLFLLHFQTLITSIIAISTTQPINISHFLYPKTNFIDFDPHTQPSFFLKDVLVAISDEQKWNPDDVRVSKFDVRKAKYGNLQKYNVQLGLGKRESVFKLLDEKSVWKKFKRAGDFESLVKEIASKAVLDVLRVEGPFELQVGGVDKLLLKLPLNTTHTGLKRILVGEGITLEVRGAQEVSLFHSSDLRQQVVNRSAVTTDREGSDFASFWHSLCMPLLPIRILSSASVVAYRTLNPDSYIETAFLSSDTIELLPHKCYIRRTQKKRGCPIDSLSLRIALLEKLFRSHLVSHRTKHNAVSGFVKAKIKASTIFHFELEIERDVRRNDTVWSTAAEWRTRPTIEREWFEVMARIEAEKLKPLMVKMVRPFLSVESSSWSNLMSNISFTEIPSLLVPPDPLTLDVKW